MAQATTNSLEHHPLAELLRLAAPTVLQMASYTLMQFCDTWMLAKATSSVDGPTAVGNAGLLAFSFISFGMGVLWVVNTLVSQSFGRKTYGECGRYMWQGIWFSIAYSAVLLMVLPFLSAAFRLMGHEANLVGLENLYLRIVLSITVVKLVGTSFSQFLLAINRPGMVFMATIAGVSVNALAAYVMVFGKFGCPQLGVAGTGWAQNIGVCVESLCLIAFASIPAIRRTFNTFDWKLRWVEMKTLLWVGAPAGVQIVADVLAWSLFGMWIIAQFGTAAMAGNNFMMQYMKVSFMPAFGIAIAVTALVGRCIGMGRPDLAERCANLGFVVCATYMLSCGILFFLARHALIGIFTSDPEVLKIGAMLLIFAAIYQFFDAMYIVYNGALRGAGDTFVPALATALLNWGITVLGGFLVARHFKSVGPAGPWSAATAYGIILGVFMLTRFRRGGWRSIQLEPAAHADTVPNVATAK